MATVIVLNGPPGCGKDTIGKLFAEKEGYYLLSFKNRMFSIAAASLGMDVSEFLEKYEDREWKESPRVEWGGKSIRDFMIHISEAYMKPFFGKDVFGNFISSDINKLRPFIREFVMTDGGFASEVESLVKNGNDVILVHMHREGCSFKGDSRTYVQTPMIDKTYTLTNDSSMEAAVDALTRIVYEHKGLRTGTY